MFDLSWSELLLVGAIALVVIGPRELPRVLRTIGQALAKARRMAGEFQTQFNAAMREAEIDELRNNLHSVHETASNAMATKADVAIKPLQNIRDEIRDAINKTDSEKQSVPLSYSIDPELNVSLGRKADNSLAVISPIPDFKPQIAAEARQPSSVVVKSRKSKHLRKSRRVIIAAPRDVVKPLTRQPKGAARLYKKTRFSAMPARKRHIKPVPHVHDEQDNT